MITDLEEILPRELWDSLAWVGRLGTGWSVSCPKPQPPTR